MKKKIKSIIVKQAMKVTSGEGVIMTSAKMVVKIIARTLAYINAAQHIFAAPRLKR